MSENIENFVAALTGSLQNDTFVKMTLGNFKGADEHLQKLLIRLIKTKKGVRLFFLYRYDTRDTAKNYDFAEGAKLIGRILGTDFFSGHLFTTENDFQLDIGKHGKSRLNTAKPTFKTVTSRKHDREKTAQIDQNSLYLKALGVTNDHGQVRDREQSKWRQINKFVEVLANLVDKSSLKDRATLTILDMGSGKGYLTFAAYDYFKNIRNIDVRVTGVDVKSELVGLCNDIARASYFDGLEFVHGSIDDFAVKDVDILIALHACNTATDEAIFKGICAKAELIVAAPCCHHELRPQLQPPAMFRDILKHGVMAERVAETITDGLRSLLLERSGYSTRLFEFVATEHTPKNNLLVGTRLAMAKNSDEFDQQINEIKEFYGIREQRLAVLLDSTNGALK